MSKRIDIWRILKEGEPPKRLSPAHFAKEEALECAIASDITILDQNLLIIGRQVDTRSGGVIDLLALDVFGHVAVIELKRQEAPRDVIAQVLEYGAWVRSLDFSKIQDIYGDYMKRYNPNVTTRSLEETFCDRFAAKQLPEITGEHKLIVVASKLDERTDRVVEYLSNYFTVPLNIAYFQYYREGELEYLIRNWLTEPDELGNRELERKWNGEYYVSFGEAPDRKWEDARKYGYIAAGGSRWFSKTLSNLQVGDRVWVNIPRKGYVAVGRVKNTVKSIAEFKLQLDDGNYCPISQVVTDLPDANKPEDELEYFVSVDWIKAVAVEDAVSEKGFFGNQNIVARPTAQSWVFTVDRLKTRWSIHG